MSTLLRNILSNLENEKVLEFLKIDRKSSEHSMLSFEDKDFYTHEGLDDFLEIDTPPNSKYILDNNGIVVIPFTGEIIAFQFGRFERAFKILNPKKYRKSYRHIKFGLMKNLKFHAASKISLGYFSNVYDDANTVIDIRKLGENWGLGIYCLGFGAIVIKEYFESK